MTQEELEQSWNGLSRALLSQAGIKPKARCDWSDLLPEHCAGPCCLDHDATDYIDDTTKGVIYE